MDLAALFDRLTATLQRWLEEFVASLPNIVVALLVVVVTIYGSRVVGRVVRRVLTRLLDSESLASVLGTIARVAAVIVGLMIALGLMQLDKTVTSLLAGVGVVGLALGFAFQDIAANFMSGFIMAIKRPFEIGDLVEIGGHRGLITRLELRSTQMTTLQGLVVIIPNKDVFQSPIVNYSTTPRRRMDLTIGVSYDASLEQARSVALAAVQAVPGRDESREPEIFYKQFGESSIDFDLRIWLAASDEPSYLAARSEAIIAVKAAFDEHDIVIPFPIRTLDLPPELMARLGRGQDTQSAAAEPPSAP